MSRHFELMDQRPRDSMAVQPPPRSGLRSTPNPPNRYPRTVIDAREEMSVAGLWRIIRNRKWTITAFAAVVVVIVVTASFLTKPQYEASARVVFHRESDS